MAQDPLQRYVRALGKPSAQNYKGSQLRCCGVGVSFAPMGVVNAAEVTDKRYSKVRVVAGGVSTLAPFGSSGLDPAIGENQEVIGDVIRVAEANCFKAALLVKMIYLAFVGRRLIAGRNSAGVVDDDSRRRDRIEE